MIENLAFERQRMDPLDRRRTTMRFTHAAGLEDISSSCDGHFESVSDESSWNAQGDFWMVGER